MSKLNDFDKTYIETLEDVLQNGVEKKDRTGVGTRSVFGRMMRFDLKKGFPLLTTKKMYFNGIVHELIWFLRGETNIKSLLENKVGIWTKNAYGFYKKKVDNPVSLKEFKQKTLNGEKTIDKNGEVYTFGDLGDVYGKQWRKWKNYNFKKSIDQINKAIKTLKENPDSRRNMVLAWNVPQIESMALPPCHYGFQLYSKPTENGRELSLMWNQRSADFFLGVPFNIASYGLLLKILANLTNHSEGELIGSLGDTHVYKNHLEATKTQREYAKSFRQYNPPQVEIVPLEDIDDLTFEHITLKGYKSHPSIKAPMAV